MCWSGCGVRVEKKGVGIRAEVCAELLGTTFVGDCVRVAPGDVPCGVVIDKTGGAAAENTRARVCCDNVVVGVRRGRGQDSKGVFFVARERCEGASEHE